jgi:quinol monooxygenase YgiN
MYARSTTISADPDRLDTGTTYVREESMPVLRGMTGCAGLSLLADRGSGRCILTTSWQDEDALRASRDGVRPHLEATAAALGGRPDVQEWEMAAMHRVHEGHSAACSRVTWLRTEPGAVQRAVDAVRLSLMPKLDDLPGFCSVSVMVRAEEGLAVASVSYDSWADLAQADAGAREFREEFAPPRGIEVLDSGDFDLVLAHLGVPETT